MNLNEMSVDDLLKAKSEAQKIVSQDISKWDRRTYTGMEGLVKKKKVEIEKINEVLTGKILQNSVAVLLKRDVSSADEIINFAKSKSKNVLSFDELRVEKELADKIYAHTNNSKGYAFNTDALNKLNILLVPYWDEVLATSVPSVYGSANLYGVSKTKDEVALKIERVIFDAYQTGFKVPLFRKYLLDNCKEYLTSPSLMIFYKNVTDDFLKGFSSYVGKSIVVTEDPAAVGSVILTNDTTPEDFVNVLFQANKLK